MIMCALCLQNSILSKKKGKQTSALGQTVSLEKYVDAVLGTFASEHCFHMYVSALVSNTALCLASANDMNHTLDPQACS